MTPEQFNAWDGVETLPGVRDVDVVFEVVGRISIAAFRFATGTGYEVEYFRQVSPGDVHTAISLLTGRQAPMVSTVRATDYVTGFAVWRSRFWQPAESIDD